MPSVPQRTLGTDVWRQAADRQRLALALVLSLGLHGLALGLPAPAVPPSARDVARSGGIAATARPPLAVTMRSAAMRAEERPILETDLSPANQADIPNEAPAGQSSGNAVLMPAYFPSSMLTRMPEALTEFGPETPDVPESRVGGRLELRLWLDRTGHIDRVELLRAEATDILATSAIKAFASMRFRPAEIEGMPVGSWSDVVIEFEALPSASPPSLP